MRAWDNAMYERILKLQAICEMAPYEYVSAFPIANLMRGEFLRSYGPAVSIWGGRVRWLRFDIGIFMLGVLPMCMCAGLYVAARLGPHGYANILCWALLSLGIASPFVWRWTPPLRRALRLRCRRLGDEEFAEQVRAYCPQVPKGFAVEARRAVAAVYGVDAELIGPADGRRRMASYVHKALPLAEEILGRLWLSLAGQIDPDRLLASADEACGRRPSKVADIVEFLYEQSRWIAERAKRNGLCAGETSPIEDGGGRPPLSY